MKKGDLVRYCGSDFLEPEIQRTGFETGIVLEDPKVWKDSGAPDRNCGVNVLVLWSDGQISSYEEYELEVVDENR